MISDDGLMTNVDRDEDYDGKRNHEDVNVHREALWGGGWCLEWLHPPPNGVMIERALERKAKMERHQIRGENVYLPYVPHKGFL